MTQSVHGGFLRDDATGALITSGSGSQRIGRMVSIGHSWVAGGTSLTKVADCYASRLAAALGCEDINVGKSSAVMANADSDANPGGYATTMRTVRPSRQVAPYNPFADFFAISAGYNALWTLSSDPATSLGYEKQAMRAIIARCRAGSVFEDEHASVAYTGTWSTAGGSDAVNSNGTLHSSATVGDKITITVPADYPGTEIALAFQAGTTGGAQMSIAVDGGAAVSADFRTALNGGAGGSGRKSTGVYMLRGLSSGSHTIVATITALAAGGGSCFFDWWSIGAEQMPLVHLYTFWQSAASVAQAGVHTPTTQADVVLLNAMIVSLAAEWDSYVQLVDIGGALQAYGSALMYTDGLHPSADGHAFIAKTILAALASGPKVYPTPEAQTPFRRFIGATQQPAYGTGFSAKAAANNFDAWFYKIGRTVYLGGLCKNALATPSPTTLWTMPTTMKPSQTVTRVCMSNTNALATLFISFAGNVGWMFGDASVQISLDGITYDADG